MVQLLLIANISSDPKKVFPWLQHPNIDWQLAKTDSDVEASMQAKAFDLCIVDFNTAESCKLLQEAEASTCFLNVPIVLLVTEDALCTASRDFRSRTFEILPLPVCQDTLMVSIHRAIRFNEFRIKNQRQQEINRRYQIELETLLKEQNIRMHEMELNLEMLFELAPFGLCMSNAEGTILSANETFMSISGQTGNDKTHAKNLASLFADKSEFKNLSEHFTQGKPVLGKETVFCTQDGSTSNVTFSIAPFIYKDRQCFISLIQDRSELHNAKSGAQKEAHLLESIIDNIPLSIVVRQATDHSIVKINKATEALIGYSRDELLHNSEAYLFSEAELSTFIKHDLEVIESKQKVEVLDKPLTTYHNGIRRLHVRKIPIFDDSQNVEFVVGIIEDITEKLSFQNALIEATEKAEAMSDLRASLLQNLSHEIRTPLSGLIGFAQVVADELEGELSDRVRMIAAGGKRLMGTIQNVMSLSLIESGNVKLDLQVQNVGDVISDVVSSLKPQADASGLTLTSKVIDGPIMSILDHKSLQSIVHNLVENAIKYTEKGSVRVFVRAIANVVEIEVRDTGIGVDPSFIPFIFDTFQQESKGTTRSHDGNGIGLAIAKGLVELHRGEIHVVSKKGRGSTFVVSLPLFTVVNPTTSKLLKNRVNRTPFKRLESVRMLTFDPTNNSRTEDRSWIEDVKRVQCWDWTASAAGVFRMAQEKNYNLFLIDLDHEHAQESYDLVRDLKESTTQTNSHIVALKTTFTDEERAEFKSMGFSDCLEKPVNASQLGEFIDNNFSADTKNTFPSPTLVSRRFPLSTQG